MRYREWKSRERGERCGEWKMRDKKLWVSFVPILFVFCGGEGGCERGYIIPNNKNFHPRKLSFPRKRLWYDARMSSSTFQVESPEVRSHGTLTIGISFPHSCFIWESKILIGLGLKERFFFTCTKSDSRMWLGSGMLWILTKGGGKASSYTIGPILLRIW